jgi:hypothetical protein
MLRALFERCFWRLAGLLATRRKVGSLDFVFVNARGDRFMQELAPVLEQALDRIAIAGTPYRTLVKDNLKFVAAANIRDAYVSVPARGYVSAFRNSEVVSPHYLAANLVWAAEFIRFQQSEPILGRKSSGAAARTAARNAQLRFVREFPDSDAWVAFLEQHTL